MYKDKQQEARRKRNDKIADFIVNAIIVIAVAFLAGSLIYAIGNSVEAW